jgi:hypothetical protein
MGTAEEGTDMCQLLGKWATMKVEESKMVKVKVEE